MLTVLTTGELQNGGFALFQVDKPESGRRKWCFRRAYLQWSRVKDLVA